MQRIWSEESKLAHWLEVELAAVEAWAELGVVPASEARELRARATPPTPARVAEIEQTTHHDVAAFVDAVAENVGPAARFLHFGLTSSDLLDTALALQVGEAGALIQNGIAEVIATLVSRAQEHCGTVMIGRTHGVQAEPLTLGVKLAGFAFELDRASGRLDRALQGMRVGKVAGAVGVYGGGDPELERLVLSRLGLQHEPVATQVVARDRHAELLASLALTASSLERLATEIRHLARTEVHEVEEPFGRGQKGSSAMPHKRNPVVAERICGLARVVRAAAAVGLENVPLWHERDISHSSAERVIIPDAFLALDYMLGKAAWLFGGLVVHADRMRENLEASGGLVFSQRLLLALVSAGCERDEAYRLVQRNAMASWESGAVFRSLIEQDDEVTGRLAPGTLEEAFDLERALEHVPVVFERLSALIETKEVAARA